MLINTVVLFLRDALPIFIAIALILGTTTTRQNRANINRDKRHIIAFGVPLGLCMASFLAATIADLSKLFDGIGSEVIYALCCLFIYSALTLGLLNHRFTIRAFLAALAIIIAMHGAQFNVFIIGYWSMHGAPMSILIGTLLGAGICVSVAILLYFGAQMISKNIRLNLSALLLLCFASGQLIKLTQLLMQADLITTSENLYNSSFILDESSLWGHLVIALCGYDATPTLVQVLTYVVSIGIPLILIRIKRLNTFHHAKAYS